MKRYEDLRHLGNFNLDAKLFFEAKGVELKDVSIFADKRRDENGSIEEREGKETVALEIFGDGHIAFVDSGWDIPEEWFEEELKVGADEEVVTIHRTV